MSRWRRLWQTVCRVLTRPLFNTITIPRDARVDPSQFSPDEYPVWCSDCGYLLRGLPEDRCPECGKAFDRGGLLVQQYVWLRLPRRHRAKRWSRRLFWSGMVAYCGTVLCFIVFGVITREGVDDWIVTKTDQVLGGVGLLGVKALGWVLMMAGSLVQFFATRPLLKKRKAVLLAARADVLRARAAVSATSK